MIPDSVLKMLRRALQHWDYHEIKAENGITFHLQNPYPNGTDLVISFSDRHTLTFGDQIITETDPMQIVSYTVSFLNGPHSIIELITPKQTRTLFSRRIFDRSDLISLQEKLGLPILDPLTFFKENTLICRNWNPARDTVNYLYELDSRPTPCRPPLFLKEAPAADRVDSPGILFGYQITAGWMLKIGMLAMQSISIDQDGTITRQRRLSGEETTVSIDPVKAPDALLQQLRDSIQPYQQRLLSTDTSIPSEILDASDIAYCFAGITIRTLAISAEEYRRRLFFDPVMEENRMAALQQRALVGTLYETCRTLLGQYGIPLLK